MVLCEMCGKEGRLVNADVEGVELSLCTNCAKYGEVKKRSARPSFFKRSFSKKEEPQFRIVGNYAALIRSARENKEMTQEEFAKSLNERESVVSKWESGQLKPRIGVARQLGRMLGINLLKRDTPGKVELGAKKVSDVLTLGDFIKVRKRK